jgi:hypothetical protein
MGISRKPSPLQNRIDQKQLGNVEYFNYLGNLLTNGARCTHELKFRITMTKAASNKKNDFFTRKLDLNLRGKN